MEVHDDHQDPFLNLRNLNWDDIEADWDKKKRCMEDLYNKEGMMKILETRSWENANENFITFLLHQLSVWGGAYRPEYQGKERAQLTRQIVIEIGKSLHNKGGTNLMRKLVNFPGGVHGFIERHWTGIGDWRFYGKPL